MEQTVGGAPVGRTRSSVDRQARREPPDAEATIVPLGRRAGVRPTLPDPMEDSVAVAAIVAASVIEMSGLGDGVIARRLARKRQAPITAAVVARWRAGLALPDLPTFLQLVALAGASALGCLAGMPLEA